MKHFTIKFLSLMVFTFVSFISYGQYCTFGVGPTNTADSNLGSLDITAGAGSSMSYTGCNPAVIGVEDSTSSITLTMDVDSSYTGIVTWGTCGGNFGNAGTIWIDWDNSGTFDASDVVHTWSGTPLATDTFTITVPSSGGVAAGSPTVRMRVTQQESGVLPLDPCAGFTWGTVLDIGVTINGGNLCAAPTNANVSIGDTFATVSFMSASGNSTIEWGAAGFTPGTGTIINNATSPYTINGLMANNTYDVYVSDSCASQGNSSSPVLLSFTTACVVTAPYMYGFEGAFDACWVQDQNDVFDWTQQSGGTGSGGTGPSSASEGSEYMYIETSFPRVQGDDAILVSPLVDVSALTSAAMRFDYHMLGNAMGTLAVQVDSALTGNWVTVWSVSGNQGNQWNIAAVPLANYGSLVKIRFVGITGSSFTSDAAIDNVRFEEFCIPVETAPFLESFEFGCYEQDTMDTFDWTITSGATPSPATGANGPSEGNSYAFTESSAAFGVGAGDSAIMVTQYINIQNLAYPELTFDYHMYDGGTDQMGELRVEMTTDMGMTWAPIWSIEGNQEELWRQAAVNLQLAGATDTVGLRFIGILGGDHDPATGNGNSWHSDISLDNIRIDNGLAFDLALVDVLEDYSTCAGAGNQVVLEVENQGFTPVTGFQFGAIVNGTQLSQMYMDTIMPGATALLVLNNSIDLLPGLNGLGYGFDGTAFGDLDPSNDQTLGTFVAAPSEDGENYATDYEMGAMGWYGEGDFEMGMPAGTVISGAAGGASAWVTSLTGNYSDATTSYLYSPCFDLSGYATDPVVSFDANWDIEDDWDGAWLEVSTDGGYTWSKLGGLGTGTNWYDTDVTQNPIGHVWNGTGANGSGGWVNASHLVDGAAGAGSVQFRFVLFADAATNNEGFGVDNFMVMSDCPADLGLSATLFSVTDTLPNGGIFVSATAGTAPYTYSWSNGQTTALASDLTANTLYTVVVTDANGCSDSLTAQVFPVSNDFIASMNELNIFPNPTQTTANIVVGFEQAVNVEVELVNVVGQVLTSERREGVTNHSFTFDVENYPAGVYMVRINANNERITRRLVIAK